MQNFLIEDFFHLLPVSTTLDVHLELRISSQIFEKIGNGPNGIIRGLGETDPCRKSRGTVPLNLSNRQGNYDMRIKYRHHVYVKLCSTVLYVQYRGHDSALNFDYCALCTI